MLKVSQTTGPKQAMEFADALVREAVSTGAQVVVRLEDVSVTLPRSPLIRELGGGAAHVSPDIASFEKGLKVEPKIGAKPEEQGLFISHEPSVQFTQGAASGAGTIPVPVSGGFLSDLGKVTEIGKYRPADLVKIDAPVIRRLNLADIKVIPEKLAIPLENYIRANGGRIAGSFAEWLRVPSAVRPHDLDLVFRDRLKAIRDILDIAKKEGFTAREVEKGVEILGKDGKWVRIAEVRSAAGYELMIPKGLTQPPAVIDGINVTRLGEQYFRQSLGAVAKDAKAGARTEKLERAARLVLKQLKKAGDRKSVV
jgi:hypothetical protein